jgi:hypothetical protein
LKMMLTYSHMSIIQALQQPSYQLHYQQPSYQLHYQQLVLVWGGHLPFFQVVAFRSVFT